MPEDILLTGDRATMQPLMPGRIYPASVLHLYKRYTRESYAQRFGVEPPAFDEKKAVKLWAAHAEGWPGVCGYYRPAVGTTPPEWLDVPELSPEEVNIPDTATLAVIGDRLLDVRVPVPCRKLAENERWVLDQARGWCVLVGVDEEPAPAPVTCGMTANMLTTINTMAGDITAMRRELAEIKRTLEG